MVGGINFKNLGREGIITGLDDEGAMKAKFAPQQASIDLVKSSITDDGKKVSAYTTFNNLLLNLQNTADTLRGRAVDINGIDLFNKRSVFLSNATGNANSFVSAVAASGAQINSNGYSLSIANIAEAQTDATRSFTSNIDPTITGAAGSNLPNKFQAGTFQIRSNAAKPWVNVTIPAGATLQTIAAAINSVAEKSGAQATIITSGSGYFLQIQSTLTGISNAFTMLDPDGVFTNVSLAPTQGALDALYTFANVATTSPLNTIQNIVAGGSGALASDGLTISLIQPTGGVPVHIAVDQDQQQLITGVQNFVNAYNQVMIFQAEQQQKDPITGNFIETAVLGFDNVLGNATSWFGQIIAQGVVGIDPSVTDNMFSAVGIATYNQEEDYATNTPAVKNLLKFDPSIFATTFAGSASVVRNIFAFSYTSNSASTLISKHSGTLSVNNFTLDIDPTRNGVGQHVAILSYTDASNVLRTVYPTYAANANGGSITGPSGSVFSGITLSWVGSSAEIVTFNATQGLCDLIYNAASIYTDSTPGLRGVPHGLVPATIASLQSDLKDWYIQQSSLEENLKGLQANYKEALSRLEQKASQLNAAASYIHTLFNPPSKD
jgi:flagellar capping protein FliD